MEWAKTMTIGTCGLFDGFFTKAVYTDFVLPRIKVEYLYTGKILRLRYYQDVSIQLTAKYRPTGIKKVPAYLLSCIKQPYMLPDIFVFCYSA